MLPISHLKLYDMDAGKTNWGANPGASPSANALGCFAKLEGVRQSIQT
jgi:hypothetical protein